MVFDCLKLFRVKNKACQFCLISCFQSIEITIWWKNWQPGFPNDAIFLTFCNFLQTNYSLSPIKHKIPKECSQNINQSLKNKCKDESLNKYYIYEMMIHDWNYHNVLQLSDMFGLVTSKHILVLIWINWLSYKKY